MTSISASHISPSNAVGIDTTQPKHFLSDMLNHFLSTNISSENWDEAQKTNEQQLQQLLIRTFQTVFKFLLPDCPVVVTEKIIFLTASTEGHPVNGSTDIVIFIGEPQRVTIESLEAIVDKLKRKIDQQDPLSFEDYSLTQCIDTINIELKREVLLSSRHCAAARASSVGCLSGAMSQASQAARYLVSLGFRALTPVFSLAWNMYHDIHQGSTPINTSLDMARLLSPHVEQWLTLAHGGFLFRGQSTKRLIARNPLAFRLKKIAQADDSFIEGGSMAFGSVCHVCQVSDDTVLKIAFEVDGMMAEYAKVETLKAKRIQLNCDQHEFSSFLPLYHGRPTPDDSCGVPFAHVQMEKLLSLKQCMQHGSVLDSDDAKIELILRLLHFLQTLQKEEDFHGDIKPHNLMIRLADGAWQLVVIDWSTGYFTPGFNYSGTGEKEDTAAVRDVHGLLTLIPWLFRRSKTRDLRRLLEQGTEVIKKHPCLLSNFTDLKRFPILTTNQSLRDLAEIAERDAEIAAVRESSAAEIAELRARLEALEAKKSVAQ
eukprot:gnl/Dysnectes_brevis/1932_a2219_2569.p1 GENE.gnl/Dysnectes_brevis/1932_a2219_2569~~gnl/Dysnectes_brevis/1932_a2219_2569.p1  ORF type:complete len:542 (-),score=61.46 gnl/Dysnectes_brevis/1932_a2219_2569:96-1721(-)